MREFLFLNAWVGRAIMFVEVLFSSTV